MARFSPIPALTIRLRSPLRVSFRRILRVAVVLAMILIGIEVVRVTLGNNLHWAISGRVLRSAQLAEPSMKETIRKFGLKTVINLRGCSNPMEWYTAETRATHEMNVSQEDITLSAYRFPARQEISRLIEVLDSSEYPVLLHCRRGADRTGLAAAVAVLLTESGNLETARSQIDVRYGHFRFMNAARMDDFLDFYETNLKERGESHTPDRFRKWVRERYSPGPGLAKLELLDHREVYSAKESIRLTLRSKNISNFPWHLKPGSFSGIHARFVLVGPDGKPAIIDRAGEFEATVSPGESIDLTIGLPPLKRPGKYHLMVDMALNQAISFVQLGSEPLYAPIEIRD